jgi:two-component system, response regulator FlrC
VDAVHHEILIIEDDEGIRDALGQLFSLSEIPNRIFDSALKALQYLNSNPGKSVPLVFLDGHLPDLSAQDAIRKLRECLPANTAIYLLSGDPQLAVQLENSGLSGYIPKPFDASRLIDLVQQYLPSGM